MSLEQKRGIETIDLNQFLILVKAPIESVAPAFSQARQADIWERDVYDREVEFVGQGFIVFQFQGHPWTLISRVNFIPYRTSLEKKDAQTLSHLLHTRAIYYRVSDTSGYIGYELYEDGKSIETLSSEEEIFLEFQSQNRPFKPEDIKNAYNFVYDFMLEQDIYIPALFRVVIQQGTLRLKGPEVEDLVRNDFERLDYLAIR